MLTKPDTRSFTPEAATAVTALPCGHTPVIDKSQFGYVPALVERRTR
jgi:hypothetical protein